MTVVITTPIDTVSAVARLLDSAARIHENRGEDALADRFRMRADAVRALTSD